MFRRIRGFGQNPRDYVPANTSLCKLDIRELIGCILDGEFIRIGIVDFLYLPVNVY